jgi:hypothetical protein
MSQIDDQIALRLSVQLLRCLVPCPFLKSASSLDIACSREAASVTSTVCDCGSASCWLVRGAFIQRYSSDAGRHYALIRALMDLDKWGSPAATPNLGTLPFYPPVSHWLAAEVFGSGLLGMTLVASASVGLSCLPCSSYLFG